MHRPDALGLRECAEIIRLQRPTHAAETFVPLDISEICGISSGTVYIGRGYRRMSPFSFSISPAALSFHLQSTLSLNTTVSFSPGAAWAAHRYTYLLCFPFRVMIGRCRLFTLPTRRCSHV